MLTSNAISVVMIMSDTSGTTERYVMVYKWLWIGLTAFIFVLAAAEAIAQFASIFSAQNGDVAQVRAMGGVVFLIGALVWGAISWEGFKARKTML